MTCYGLDSLRIKFRWGQDFLHPSTLAVEPTQAPAQWATEVFTRGKAAEAWR